MKIAQTMLAIAISICLSGCGGGGGNAHPTSAPNLTLNVLAVGQGDSVYIKMPDGRDVLIDGGPGDDVMKRLPQVMDKGDQEISLIILTHPHLDHLIGLIKVVGKYKVDEIWETGVDFPSPDYAYWKLLVKERGIPDKKVFAGESMTFGGAQLQTIAPANSYDGVALIDPNSSSIVCQLSYGAFKALLLGDAIASEQAAFTPFLEHQTIVKVPHHGAADAAYEPLWQRTQPDISILTVSKLSQYVNLPTQQAQDLIQKYSRTTYRTDLNGIVSVTTDGTTWRTKTQY